MDEKCFWCVYERIEAQKFSEAADAITLYEGTPVCATHANWIGRELMKREGKMRELMTAARM